MPNDDLFTAADVEAVRRTRDYLSEESRWNHAGGFCNNGRACLMAAYAIVNLGHVVKGDVLRGPQGRIDEAGIARGARVLGFGELGAAYGFNDDVCPDHAALLAYLDNRIDDLARAVS